MAQAARIGIGVAEGGRGDAEGETPVVVERRFCGPPGSANGGYAVGLLAEQLGGSVTVTLRRPVPLEEPLSLRREAGGRGVALWDRAGSPLAEGRAGSGAAPALPASPGWQAASEAARRPLFDAARHPCPECFVCGTARLPGDGLAILPGRVAEASCGLAAAPWRPSPDLAGTDGLVAPRFHWAALDCPGAIAAVGDAPRPILLGRLSGSLVRRVRVGEPCVVVGWTLAWEGRKHRAATALYDGEGRPCAWSEQIWIEPRRPCAQDPG